MGIAIAAGLVFLWMRSSRNQALEVGSGSAAPAPMPAVRSTPRAEPSRSAADEIEKLWRLKEEGALTQAEFEDQKARLIAGGPGTGAAPGYQLVLLAAGTNKISAIKEVREITRLGLKEAKDLVESPPQVVAEGLTADQAETMRQAFVAIGASVEVR